MRFDFKPSFERSIRQLPDNEKQEIKEVAIQLVDILSRDRHISKGAGLKRLRGDFWEARNRNPFIWKIHFAEFPACAILNPLTTT